MSVRSFSAMTSNSALALQRFGRQKESHRLMRSLLGDLRRLAGSPAVIDYFATSLPTMLRFKDELAARQQIAALFLEAQARLGLGQRTAARRLLRSVRRRDHSHAAAADLLASAGGLRSLPRLRP